MSVNKTLSIAILSGKGGVGKSNLALNLAYALGKKQAKVLLIDCDLGLANLDVLMGITPKSNIQSLLDSSVKPEELIVPLAPGLEMLPANSGILDSLEADNALPEMMAEKLDALVRKYDYAILDVGAGISSTALAFGAMALMRLLVITPEPTSLTDSYALVKVLDTTYGMRDYFVLVNQTASVKEEEQAFKRLQAACNHFLEINPTLLGGVRNDTKLADAVRQQKPVLTAFPTSKFSTDVSVIADKIAKLRNNIMPRIADRTPLSRPGRNKVKE